MANIKFKGIGEFPYGSSAEVFNIGSSGQSKNLGAETATLDGSIYKLLRGVTGLTEGDLVLYDKNFNTILAVSGAATGTAYQGYAIYAGNNSDPANSSSKAGYFLVKGTGRIKVPTGFVANSKPYLSATPGLVSAAVVSGDEVPGLSIQTSESSNFSEVYVYSNGMNLGGGSASVPPTVATGVLTGSNYALTYSPVAPTLTPGLEISFLPDANNPIGPITLDGVAVKKYTPTVTDLAAGDFQGGNAYSILWNGTNWVAQVGGGTAATYRVTQTLAAGNNILNHNLGYSDVLVSVRDSVTGEEVLVEVVAETATTTTVKVLASVVNAVITVK